MHCNRTACISCSSNEHWQQTNTTSTTELHLSHGSYEDSRTDSSSANNSTKPMNHTSQRVCMIYLPSGMTYVLARGLCTARTMQDFSPHKHNPKTSGFETLTLSTEHTYAASGNLDWMLLLQVLLLLVHLIPTIAAELITTHDALN